MDVDLGEVRALLAVIDHGHFGRAADTLGISQQALSKRIARLEQAAGAILLDRTSHPIAPTQAAARFLPAARHLLGAADQAWKSLRPTPAPLRIDMWGHMYDPMRTLRIGLTDRQLIAADIGHARDLPGAVAALHRGDIDAGFGRFHPVADVNADALRSEVVRLEPLDVLVSASHRLAGADSLRLSQLRGDRLWSPVSFERLDFMAQLAREFGLATEVTECGNLGLEHLLEEIARDPGRYTVGPADLPLPRNPGLRSIPVVDPTPLYAWSLVWRRDDPSEQLLRMRAAFKDAGRARRWVEYDAARDWLPPNDLRAVAA